MKSTFETVNLQNTQAIEAEIFQLDEISYETVSALLPGLIAEGKLKLDHSIYVPHNSLLYHKKGVGRYLIYDYPDKTNPFSIWAFALAPRQKTSIHDHKYKGTVVVLEGPVTEKFYQPTVENRARLFSRKDRHSFHYNSDNLSETEDLFVHQLKCRKDLNVDRSITLHIYNMEAQTLGQDGVLVDNRNLNITYTKEKTDKRTHPDYEQEYPNTTVSFPY